MQQVIFSDFKFIQLVAHTCNSNTQEPDTGGWYIFGKLWLCRETLLKTSFPQFFFFKFK
jgi:hypothetical protein